MTSTTISSQIMRKPQNMVLDKLGPIGYVQIGEAQGVRDEA